MGLVDDVLEKKVQIRCSKLYCSLNTKSENRLGVSMEQYVQRSATIAGKIARSTKRNDEEAEFLAMIKGVGHLDGGVSTLDLFNSCLPKGREKILPREVMAHNFIEIFPRAKETFSPQALAEISQLWETVPSTEYAKIVDMAYKIEFVSEKLRVQNNWNEMDLFNFISEQVSEIKRVYEHKGVLQAPPKLEKLFSKLSHQKNNQIVSEEMKGILQRYTSNEISKSETISRLNVLQIDKKKINFRK